MLEELRMLLMMLFITTDQLTSLKQTTGNLPTSTAHWNTFAKGSGGIWNAGLSFRNSNQGSLL